MDLCSPAPSPTNRSAGRMNPARGDTGAESHRRGSGQGAVSERRHRARDQALLRNGGPCYHGLSLGAAKWDFAEGASCGTGVGDGANGQGVMERPRRTDAPLAAAALGVRGALTDN